MFKILRIRANILFHEFIKQRGKYISDKNFLLVASGITGILSGLAAVLLKYLVHFFQWVCQSGFDIKYENYLYLMYPLVGILLTMLYLRLFHYKLNFDKGLSSIIYAITHKASRVELHKTYSHLITSALTIGFGGSAGLEAPIAVTGSALGSNTAKNLWMSRQDRTLLLAGGAAAGIAAVFNSPIAGVIFSFEVLLSELSIPAFVPILIASACGALVSKLFGEQQLFFLTTNSWALNAVPFYLLLGGVCGLTSAYMIRAAVKIENFFHRRKNSWHKAILGAIGLGLFLFIFPPLYGEGYGVINELMAGNYESLLERSLFYKQQSNDTFILLFALAVALIKVVASAITIGAGGNGGIFGPSLFTGATLGFVFAHFMNSLNIVTLNEANFIAVAMCGLVSGVLHAPLTGIFLIAEITGGYVLFVPLMLVSSISYFTTRYFEPNSIYYKVLADKGLLIKDKDEELLNQMNLSALIENDFSKLRPNQTLSELVQIVASSKRNIFPVVSADEELEGIIMLDDIRSIMFERDKYDKVRVKDLMNAPPAIAYQQETVLQLIKKFEDHQIWNIPVMHENRYVGFISKSSLLSKYREQLMSKTEV